METPRVLPDDDLDRHLMRARAGDGDALTELLARCAGPLRASIRIDPPWRSHLSEDDVVQVTFTEAFLRFEQFVGANALVFQVWLKKIAQNNIRAAIRAMNSSHRPPPHRRIRDTRSEVGGEGGLIDVLGAISNTPSRVAARSEAGKHLDAALRRLPEEYQAVINLYYFEGIRGDELGARLQRSRGAAYMLLTRARDLLAEFMGTPSQFFTDSP